jgi:hypothetical protein
MTEPTIPVVEPQIPCGFLEQIEIKKVKHGAHWYDLAFMKTVPTDRYYVLKRARITVITYGQEQAIQVEGIDISSGDHILITNPCAVFHLPKPLYLSE